MNIPLNDTNDTLATIILLLKANGVTSAQLEASALVAVGHGIPEEELITSFFLRIFLTGEEYKQFDAISDEAKLSMYFSAAISRAAIAGIANKMLVLAK